MPLAGESRMSTTRSRRLMECGWGLMKIAASNTVSVIHTLYIRGPFATDASEDHTSGKLVALV